jgi:Leucine-rich repeat (LRR) protein
VNRREEASFVDMLSKQELANPALRLAQAHGDPGDAQPPPVTEDRASRRGSRNSTDVWLQNLASSAPCRATASSTSFGTTSGTLTPNTTTGSRRPSTSGTLTPNTGTGSTRPSASGTLTPNTTTGSRRPSTSGTLTPNTGTGSRRPSTSGTLTPNTGTGSRRSSYDTGEDDNDFYSIAESSVPAPGAVRVPGLHGNTSEASDDLTITLPPTVDPFHHVVAQAVDDDNSVNEDLRRRVTNLEQDLKRSYMLLTVQNSQAIAPIAPLAPSTDGSDDESGLLRRRVQELQHQLRSQSLHAPSDRSSPPPSEEMGLSTAAVGPEDMLLTAPSSRVVVATVEDGVVDTSPPSSLRPPVRLPQKQRQEQHVEQIASSDDSTNKMPTATKRFLFLLLFGCIGAGAYFGINQLFINDDSSDEELSDVNGPMPTSPPVMINTTVAPSTAPTAYPACPSIDDWFINEDPFTARGSTNRTYTVDCGVIRDVSALEIDPLTCETKCAFLLQRFAYDERCDENNTLAFTVDDEEYRNARLLLGHLGENANFTCAQAKKYTLPDPSAAPSAAPSLTLSSTPTASPTCSDVGEFFDDAEYTPFNGGRDSSFTLGCGPSRDIAVLIRNEATCGVECVARLGRTTYRGVCQVGNVVEFTLDGDFRDSPVLVGYLAENSELSCDADLVFETPSPTPGPTAETPAPTPGPTAITPPPTPSPTAVTTLPTPAPISDNSRFDQLLDLYYPGVTLDETSSEYQAVTWLALQDSRKLPIEDTWDLAERLALAALYFATNGNEWNNDSGWLSGSSQCDWRGVSCNSEDRATRLDLSNNNLSGTLIRDLGELWRLETLDLQRNSLEGSFPTQLGRLVRLVTLEISMNQIRGKVPTHIGRMTSLTDLQIHNNEFTGEIPTQISELTVLRRFAGEYNQFVGRIPTQLASLTNLANIYLGHNELVGSIPATFGSLGQLTLLSLSANELTGPLPEELAQLTLLTRLSCSQNEISSTIPREFEAWTQLTYLSLWGNRLTGTIPDELSSWTALENIYIDGNQITGGIDSFCNSDNIFEFYADCEEAGCDCCTFCCADSTCVENL